MWHYDVLQNHPGPLTLFHIWMNAEWMTLISVLRLIDPLKVFKQGCKLQLE